MTEAQLQAAVLDLCKLLGIWWYHAYQPKYDNAGWPDLVLIGSRATIFRELKKAGQDPTPEQADVGARLARSGQDWDVWRPADLRSLRILRELQAIR
jgi:hypothetical protein